MTSAANNQKTLAFGYTGLGPTYTTLRRPVVHASLPLWSVRASSPLLSSTSTGQQGPKKFESDMATRKGDLEMSGKH